MPSGDFFWGELQRKVGDGANPSMIVAVARVIEGFWIEASYFQAPGNAHSWLHLIFDRTTRHDVRSRRVATLDSVHAVSKRRLELFAVGFGVAMILMWGVAYTMYLIAKYRERRAVKPHAVSAGPASWSFDLTEPQVTLANPPWNKPFLRLRSMWRR